MNITSINRIAAAACLIAACIVTASSPPSRAGETGVSDTRIIFGQVAALSGPAAALGTGMRAGIRAAFAEANRNGGVQGHELVLVSRDDGYEPNNTIAATTGLLSDGVFALIGSVGTPTTNAILPLLAESGVPLIGPFTGSEGLRNPRNPLVVNVRASYFQETEVMVQHLTHDLGYSRIAIFYQDDSFGRAGLAGVEQALDKRGMKLVSEGAYQRNTTAVTGALLDIRRGNPEAVIMVGAYAPCAEFIKDALAQKMAATFLNISFVGADALAKALGPQGDGIVVTQVVPFPMDTSMPLVAAYQAALKASDPAEVPGFVSLEGYMAGRLAILALRKINGPLTRKAMLDAIAQTGNFNLGGITLSFSRTSNQGSNTVFLTEIDKAGNIVPVETLKSQAAAGGEIAGVPPGTN